MNEIENKVFARTIHVVRRISPLDYDLINNFRRKALARRIDNISPRVSVILNAIELGYLVSLNKI